MPNQPTPIVVWTGGIYLGRSGDMHFLPNPARHHRALTTVSAGFPRLRVFLASSWPNTAHIIVPAPSNAGFERISSVPPSCSSLARIAGIPTPDAGGLELGFALTS